MNNEKDREKKTLKGVPIADVNEVPMHMNRANPSMNQCIDQVGVVKWSTVLVSQLYPPSPGELFDLPKEIRKKCNM